MNDLKIRFSKENIKKEADIIRRLASDEIFRALKGETDFNVVRIGLIHLARSGELLKQICIHYPRRFSKLPKNVLTS